jgi:IS5 family transposase
MDQVVPWDQLLKIIEPHYPKAGNGRKPMPMDVMLRIYFLQQWYALGDQAAEKSLYDMESMRNFAGLELTEDAIPDESTILKFRHLIEKHDLGSALFDDINAYLVSQGITVSKGSMIDATIVQAPLIDKEQKWQT